MVSEEMMTYAGAGVDYGAMDTFKWIARLAGRETAGNIRQLNNGEFQGVETSRGESAFLIETADSYLAHVEEGLGTKNVVAESMYYLTGMSYYRNIAQDAVATIVNDMITLGALPLSVAMHLAVGESIWFDDQERSRDLVLGWKHACNLARCVYGGGETQTLKDIVVPGTFVLSGSAIGIVKPKGRLITADNITHGDAIILLESSGINANGLTMARKIAEKKDGFWRRLAHLFLQEYFSLHSLSLGYLTLLADGRTYGETLLDPTHIYVGLVEDCINRGIPIHYAVNITGHGWRKLMRAKQPFTYVIDRLPKQLPIFDFLQRHGPVDDREAYGNFNMGADFALYVPKADARAVLAVAASHKLSALCAGYIERSNDKKVVIEPKGLEYSSATLGI